MCRNQEQRDFARGLRNHPTDAERRLWRFLRADQLGVKFRRQAAIGSYVVDFVCFSHRLAVELDGPQHLLEDAVDHDARRDAWLSSHGFHVLRFRNEALDEDIRHVVDVIVRTLEETRPVRPLPNLPRNRGGSHTS